MKIKKIKQDNGLITDEIIISSTEPVNGDRRKVWLQTSKNLLINNFSHYTGNNLTNVALNFNKARLLTDFIEIESNTTYTISTSKNNISCLVWEYSKDKNFLRNVVDDWPNASELTFTTNSDVKYIRVLFAFTDKTTEINEVDLGECQLELGNNSTEYEPYVDKKIFIKNNNDIYEEFMKKEENKDVYSTQEIKTNKVWIDGKPIYRKVLSFITDSEIYIMKTVNIEVENIDLCFIGSMSVIINSGNNGDTSLYMVNTTRQSNDTAVGMGGHNWFRINPDRKHVGYIVSELTKSSQCYLELYYTKTTD